MDEQRQILDALDDERRLTARPFSFTVEESEMRREICRLTVEPDDDRSLLDESLEGMTATWDVPASGHANILSLLPDESAINLQFLSGLPPQRGSRLLVRPPVYLAGLIQLWQDPTLAEAGLRWFASLYNDCEVAELEAPEPKPFAFLRDRQKKSFSLLRFRCSFLWGPPGTGKTTTLGCLLAEYLHREPARRILLLAQTNTAVDQALLAVDRSLDHLQKGGERVQNTRKACRRIGLHFVPDHYAEREYLLPVSRADIIKRLSDCESRRPDPADADAYAHWRLESDTLHEELRALSRQDLEDSRLHAMTTTHAASEFRLLQDQPYDLIAIDEASQVSLACSIMLAQLGHQALFAGDFKQLAPIVQSQLPIAERWLAGSAFSMMKETSPSTCMLNEQNRMAAPICRLVSGLFYGDQLKVAKESAADPQWVADRRLVDLPEIGSSPIFVHTVHQEGVPANLGWHRPNSLDFICKTARRLAERVPQKEILIITPFRAQRFRIRRKLRELGLKEVGVSTVHRAQGSERHTVIFDPVRGGSPWLQSPSGERLITVALSRAKARLIVTLSRGDRENPILDMIDKIT